MPENYDRVTERWARTRDSALKVEPDLPPAAPRAARDAGPSVADFDRDMDIGARPTSAAQERRDRGVIDRR